MISVAAIAAYGASPTVTLSSNNLTPNRGFNFTLTANALDADGDLNTGLIVELGAGNLDGVFGGPWPSLGPAESLTGSSDSFSRTDSTPVLSSLGPRTYRVDVSDSSGNFSYDWIVVDIQNNEPIAGISGIPPIAPWTVVRNMTVSWYDIDGIITSLLTIDQFGNPLFIGSPLTPVGSASRGINVIGTIVFTNHIQDSDGDTAQAISVVHGY